MFDINNIKDIILVLLVIAVVYLYIKGSIEHFESSSTDAINRAIKYKADIDSIRNLANISKKIMADDNLTLPATLKAGVIKPFDGSTPYRVTVEARELAIDGNIQLDGTAGMCIKDRCYNSNQIHFLPRGSIIAYFDKNGLIPDGWALCDGRFYKSVDAKLSQVVDRSDTLAVETPDLRGRFILGYGKTENRTNSYTDWGNESYDKEYNFTHGETGGEFKHKLVVDEMPSHRHNFGRDYWDENLAINQGVDLGNIQRQKANDKSGETTIMGGDKPHNNMPPYYALYYIMRIA
jgi:microcystin-dependent protein